MEDLRFHRFRTVSTPSSRRIPALAQRRALSAPAHGNGNATARIPITRPAFPDPADVPRPLAIMRPMRSAPLTMRGAPLSSGAQTVLLSGPTETHGASTPVRPVS